MVNEHLPTPLDPLSLGSKIELIHGHPLFSALSPQAIDDLLAVAHEKLIEPNEVIIVEGDFIKNYFIIAEGEAIITRKSTDPHKETDELLAILRRGEAIGLNESGIFSSTGRRTATVTAVTKMLLLEISIEDFNTFLTKHRDFGKNLLEKSEWMLKLDFIKKAAPFQCLSNDQIFSIAEQIEEKKLKENTLVFNQGDEADCCYLIRSGKVEIALTEDTGKKKQLAILESPAIFGEASLLTPLPRNASARTLSESTLFVISKKLFHELIEISRGFENSVVGFTLRRFRPLHSKDVIVHQRTTREGEIIVTLQNTKLNSYYRLTKDGWFIWKNIDGIRTIQDLTIIFFHHYKVFAPDIIFELLYKLAEKGFIELPSVELKQDEEVVQDKSLAKRLIQRITGLFVFEFKYKNFDKYLDYSYNRFFWVLYKWPTQLLMIILLIAGFILFIAQSSSVASAMLETSYSVWFYILFLVLASIGTVALHEVGHALMAKRLGYRVDNIGIGWFMTGPVAYADTSALWIAGTKERVLVDLAGGYVDFFLGSCFAILSMYADNATLSIFLWLLALSTYYTGIKNLSPLHEFDGYFALMDWLDLPNLRMSSLKWVAQDQWKVLYSPASWKKHGSEIMYWLTCLVYILAISLITLFVLQFFFNTFSINYIMGIPSSIIIYAAVLLMLSLPLLRFGLEIKKMRKFLGK